MANPKLTRDQIEEIQAIASDSWGCLNFEDLPVNASRDRIVAALEKDARWQRNHNDEIQGRFDRLIQSIERRDCPQCGGEGRMCDFGDEICDACDGVGTIEAD